jgi:hypothetical protein
VCRHLLGEQSEGAPRTSSSCRLQCKAHACSEIRLHFFHVFFSANGIAMRHVSMRQLSSNSCIHCAADAARLFCRLLFLQSAMEPAQKRPRVGYEQSAFLFQCTTPQPDGSLWPPKLLQLIVNGDKHEVCCDHSQPHGTWVQLPDTLAITFHHSGGAKVKTCVFTPIQGTEAWLQNNAQPPFQGVLIPKSGGTLRRMQSTKGCRCVTCSIGLESVYIICMFMCRYLRCFVSYYIIR